ncbi:hypothetical protein TTHERM_00471950 (macronuclear) [Tetrahymena thermophila SB210]|uniref:Uncharacterized protein n=1 Tax=Tetrahymena thermophila (strain SB210) TaxID=312017 RepID=I7M6L2_TETTS|nr:hypothetical protein TTHERM_00471950 [Tetrahymena thermophila SB210]EAR85416.3 hypothetical protein TTHERM_00471950 [Tetrahymena thermophila SB210]|eukprot:XP_001033079.3 hypothetical protein TTHERM_00471950 [Tetrahymena thermophila SB210]
MSRRDMIRCLQKLVNNDPFCVYRRSYLPQRVYRSFSTQNNPSQSSSANNNNQASCQGHESDCHNLNHHHNSLMNSFKERQKEILREFDDFHRDFFSQLPFRRYAHHDHFSRLDQLFNQEFNRIRKQIFEPHNEESTKTSENEQTNSKQCQQQEQTQASQQTTQAKESANNSTQRNTQEDKNLSSKDNFVDIDTFFESPRYISDVHKIFQEEQQRLHKMFEDFESSIHKRINENDPNVHSIKSYYKRTPEGEYREYYDSKNPEKNYKIERKFEKPTLSSTSTENKTTSTSTTAAQEKIKETTQQVENQQKTTQEATKQTQTEQQEATSTNQVNQQPKQMEGTINISPELNEKAKKLSLMLKKEYMECLELARVYPNKTVGQIIDLVIESESFNKTH